jgi:hypothetical protein
MNSIMIRIRINIISKLGLNPNHNYMIRIKINIKLYNFFIIRYFQNPSFRIARVKHAAFLRS